ncbi:salicylate hydroxylase, putative [Phytophthora infestans T30-4]|uniref:Salicylate hydroxylase, putative n=2 Tax=Phytophthora infestans TaxID=4787 RepID=D0NV27_PHYIT|nr:salicylate hydroxylase, putative [Phytophthora infestans T30-4]EEY66499.1 salicylate hydroxylase, putative [Phytophthora infestans T30-4]KAF4027637.1 FAD binding domain [Phytophthora infestans]|eukprot:XP_002897018.1 salicylate hydroxylase, putative [Phytophthora infestans T30-4]
MVQSLSRDYDIAIIGGGIAGITLAIGLVRANVPVTLYESAKAFGEIGAGVALAANAARAMELLAPDIKRGFDRVGTFNLLTVKKNVWFDFRKGVGTRGNNVDDGAGKLITSVETPAGSAYVHRAHFLDEMVKLILEGVAKFDKRLQDIETLPDGDVKLKFTDGTEAVHSAVIGCDGIKSRTRKVILGEMTRPPTPSSLAAALLGDEMARNSQMYFGYHGHVLTFPIQHGDVMNVVAFASKEEWKDPNWVVGTTKEDLTKDFVGFSKHVRGIISMMENTDIWALFHHLPARTYTRKRMLVIGDAAHATTPNHGSGAAMAIEDAYVLASLLADVHHASDLKGAFEAFEKLYDFELPGYEDDVKKIAKNLQKRMRWIWEEDLEQEVADAKLFFQTAAKQKY